MVLVEQRFRVDPRGRDGPATEMMDEKIVRHGKLEPGPTRPFGQVVIGEPSDERFVQPADLLVDGPLHQQAEPRQLADVKPLASVPVSPRRGKGRHLVQVCIGNVLDKLWVHGGVGHRPRQADTWIGLGECHELVEPTIGDNGVVVKEHEKVAERGGQALVDRGGITAIGRIAHDSNRNGRRVLNPGQIDRGAVSRAVVDHDQLPRRPGMPHQGGDALPRELKLVEAGNDHRSQAHSQDSTRDNTFLTTE